MITFLDSLLNHLLQNFVDAVSLVMTFLEVGEDLEEEHLTEVMI